MNITVCPKCLKSYFAGDKHICQNDDDQEVYDIIDQYYQDAISRILKPKNKHTKQQIIKFLRNNKITNCYQYLHFCKTNRLFRKEDICSLSTYKHFISHGQNTSKMFQVFDSFVFLEFVSGYKQTPVQTLETIPVQSLAIAIKTKQMSVWYLGLSDVFEKRMKEQPSVNMWANSIGVTRIKILIDRVIDKDINVRNLKHIVNKFESNYLE